MVLFTDLPDPKDKQIALVFQNVILLSVILSHFYILLVLPGKHFVSKLVSFSAIIVCV